MDKVASDLNDYLLVVNKYFSDEKIDESKVSSWEDFSYFFSPNVRKAWEQKKRDMVRWERLFEAFSKFDWAFRPRDMSFDINHGFKVILSLKHPELPMRNIGIICHLSIVGNLIGLYYSDSMTMGNKKPICYPGSNISSVNNEQYQMDTSYFPFNNLHTKFKADVINSIQQIFPEFIEFDNRFAAYKVKSIQLDNDYYTDIDLFQVFFGVHINGVI